MVTQLNKISIFNFGKPQFVMNTELLMILVQYQLPPIQNINYKKIIDKITIK